MKEVRIYYECLEQANHFIKPIIEQVVGNDVNILLIKRPKTPEQIGKGALFAIQSLTTPDILITGVANNQEFPLVLIEFSEAVSTEDHELQRTYGAVATFLSDMYYIKLSGAKESGKVHGGAKYNPFSTPKIFIETRGYEGYIIADWPTQDNNSSKLLRNKYFPSCPPNIEILSDTIQSSVISFLGSEKSWYRNSLTYLKEKESHKSFIKLVNEASGIADLLNVWKKREGKKTDLERLRYFVREDWIGAKINRLDHAMDPDRGILTFLSFNFSHSHKILGIYALVRPKSKGVLKEKIFSLDSLKDKLSAVLSKDKTGIPDWLIDELEQAAASAEKQNTEIDFHPIWAKHQDEITSNKVVMTIAFFLDGMLLNYNGIKLTWDKRALLGDKDGEFLDLISKYFGFGLVDTPLDLIPENNEVDEDEVTYVIAHHILIPSGFKIVSISYPGAQGSGAILPNPALGREQPREYPDIIALPPSENENIDVLLNESKGMYNEAEIISDSGKILRYKNDDSLQKALNASLLEAQVITPDSFMKKIVIGVSFGITNSFDTKWNPLEVDFIFRITKRKNWAIGIFNQALSNLIPMIEGETNFPTVYRIAPRPKNPAQQKLDLL